MFQHRPACCVVDPRHAFAAARTVACTQRLVSTNARTHRLPCARASQGVNGTSSPLGGGTPAGMPAGMPAGTPAGAPAGMPGGPPKSIAEGLDMMSNMSPEMMQAQRRGTPSPRELPPSSPLPPFPPRDSSTRTRAYALAGAHTRAVASAHTFQLARARAHKCPVVFTHRLAPLRAYSRTHARTSAQSRGARTHTHAHTHALPLSPCACSSPLKLAFVSERLSARF
eukprot:2956725-Pleurochrysis_carterae.AAC.1